MSRNKFVALALGAVMAGGLGLTAYAQTRAAPIDYTKTEPWLCWPGKEGPCTATQTATEISKTGATKVLPFTRKDQGFDCFYVYPTASEDPTPNSDMVPGRETMVTFAQFGRYGAVCRQFAPLYRSVTLAALRANMGGAPMAGTDRELNYNDVRDAWNAYLKTANKGRGVILVGHSQGSGLLLRLIQNEIEGKPVQKQIIAAHLLGTTVQLPQGKDVGGTFKSTPVCKSATQTGCVVVYGSYRATLPPSVNPPSLFGRATAGNVAACTNPAALAGGKANLDTYQSLGAIEWVKGKTINTPYVRLPGMVTAECVTKGEYSYLELTVNGAPTDARNNTLVGDVGSPPMPTWGTHNGDMSAAIGDLVKLADSQGKAWMRANRK